MEIEQNSAENTQAQGTEDSTGAEDAFIGGLLGEADDADTAQAEADTADGAEEPATEDTETPPETEPQGTGQTEGAPPELVTLQMGDTAAALPAAAVQAIAKAMGKDVSALLGVMQKGMDYDSKAAPVLTLMDEFAAASGLTRDAYMQQMEQMRNENLLQSEVARVQQEFPGTPDAAARAIAQQRMDADKAQKQQAQAQTAQQIAQQRAQIQQMAAQAQHDATVKAWDAYEQESGVHKPEDIPQRVKELTQGGMTPIAAHYKWQAEQAKQEAENARKETQNRQQSAGSAQGAGADSGDAFLRGLFG